MSEPLPISFHDWIDAVQKRYGQDLSRLQTKHISAVQQLVSTDIQTLLDSQADDGLEDEEDVEMIVEDIHIYLELLLGVRSCYNANPRSSTYWQPSFSDQTLYPVMVRSTPSRPPK
jgi:hypothetical protein